VKCTRKIRQKEGGEREVADGKERKREKEVLARVQNIGYKGDTAKYSIFCNKKSI